MKEREKFGSRLGFILVSAGCAVGLGNVWKFPYICGENGGAAFVLIYLVFLAILGFPIMCAEFTVGRGSGKGAARAFEELETKGSKWHHFKWVSILGSYILMAFYTMVAGWMLYYAWREASGSLAGLEPDEVSGAFGTMLSQPGTMTIWMIVAVLLSFGVCVLGLQKGVEKITKVMMALLLILIVVLAVHSLVLPNASEGVKFYMVPNLDAIKSRGLGPVIFDAMTHAFFTLSVGIGAMEIFGSYLKKDRTIGGEAVNIILLDTFVALMAGFIIIPACFAYGVAPGAGPSLLFITLPNIFNHMAGGRIWGTAFFVFMSFAALSTVIAVFENIIAFYIDLKGFSRKKVVAGNVIFMILLSLPAVLGFNKLATFQPIGPGSSIMDLEDFLVSYNLLPLGSMIFVLFCTKKGVIKKTLLEQYSRPRQNGVNAITIREDDSVIEVRMTNGNNEIIIANRNGRAIRFHEAAVRVMGRTATGVRGITLDNDGQDEVVGMICIKDLETESVMVVSEQGYGKRSEIEDYRKTNRGGKGVKTMNITEKTGKLVTIKSVTDENDLMIINKSGITIRLKVADVRIMGRATQGVRLINLEKRNDQIGSVCKVMTESLEDEIPAEEAEGTIVSDPNADVPDIDDAADVNENESNNEIEE